MGEASSGLDRGELEICQIDRVIIVPSQTSSMIASVVVQAVLSNHITHYDTCQEYIPHTSRKPQLGRHGIDADWTEKNAEHSLDELSHALQCFSRQIFVLREGFLHSLTE